MAFWKLSYYLEGAKTILWSVHAPLKKFLEERKAKNIQSSSSSRSTVGSSSSPGTPPEPEPQQPELEQEPEVEIVAIIAGCSRFPGTPFDRTRRSEEAVQKRRRDYKMRKYVQRLRE